MFPIGTRVINQGYKGTITSHSGTDGYIVAFDYGAVLFCYCSEVRRVYE